MPSDLVIEVGLTEEPWIEYADVIVYGFDDELDHFGRRRAALEHLRRRGYFVSHWWIVDPPYPRRSSHPRELDAIRFELMRHRSFCASALTPAGEANAAAGSSGLDGEPRPVGRRQGRSRT